MVEGVKITAEVFRAYFECATKAHFTVHGERPADTFFANMHERISIASRARISQSQNPKIGLIDFKLLAEKPSLRATPFFFVDCETASYTYDRARSRHANRRNKNSIINHEYVPILYSAWRKREKFDELLVCFGAIAIGQVNKGKTPPNGRIICCDDGHNKAVRIEAHLPKAQNIIQAISAIFVATKPPSFVLNKRCAVCDFQSRCRQLALDQGNLSLISAMTTKERKKFEEKGISTITQLSYGYRPRRRRRAKPANASGTPPVKHDHKLTALAIKKAQVHVVGSPTLSFEGTPVFMDVEGMPDSDSYYLIGLRHEVQGKQREQSFWANGPEGEHDIWRDCLRALKEIENPCIVHYGAYEARFLKRMRERWEPIGHDVAFVDILIERSVNLLSCIYGRIYFPTYSNSLKEIAKWLGFDWSWPSSIPSFSNDPKDGADSFVFGDEVLEALH